MNGQSSISSVFRGMVMLGGLIAIPAIALFGSGLTDAIKQLVQRQLGINSVSAAATLSEAPLFMPAGASSPAPQTPAPQPLAAAAIGAPVAPTIPSPGNPTMAGAPVEMPTAARPPTVQPAPVPPAPPLGLQNVVPAINVAPPGTGVVQAIGYETIRPAPGPAFASLEATRDAPVQFASSVYESAANLVPVPRMAGAAGQTGLPGTPATVEVSPASDNTRRLLPLQETGGTERLQGPAGGISQDRFASMHFRLRQLGATYCLLESWGPQSELYRFHCKMGIGGSTNYTRSFEATDPDPLGAIAKVVEQVEQWRSGRP